jgi:hypothetical protein
VVLLLERGHDRRGAEGREHDEAQEAARHQAVGDKAGAAAAIAWLLFGGEHRALAHVRARGQNIELVLVLPQTLEGEIGKVAGGHGAATTARHSLPLYATRLTSQIHFG